MGDETGTTENTGVESVVVGQEIEVDVSETQGLEAIDEKLLMGVETEDESTESSKPEAEASTEETSTEKEAPATSESKEAKETAETSQAEADKEAGTETTDGPEVKAKPTESKKPPKGYVPLPAMKAARTKNRSLEAENTALASEVAELRASVQKLETPPAKEEEGGFKKLSEQELSDLTEESPDEAIKYVVKLQAHTDQEIQNRLDAARAEDLATAQREHASAVIGDAYTRIDKAVPGLYEEDSPAWTELTSFAEEIGITPEVFAMAATPEALGLLPGETEPQLIGSKAADFIEAIVGLQEKLASRGTRKETMRSELETEIRAEIEKELLAKFKKDGDPEHRSVSDLQGTKTEVREEGFGDRVLTNTEFAALSDEDKNRYLAGG